MSARPHRHVVIAGKIGGGKSTLVGLLAASCNWTPGSSVPGRSLELVIGTLLAICWANRRYRAAPAASGSTTTAVP